MEQSGFEHFCRTASYELPAEGLYADATMFSVLQRTHMNLNFSQVRYFCKVLLTNDSPVESTARSS